MRIRNPVDISEPDICNQKAELLEANSEYSVVRFTLFPFADTQPPSVGTWNWQSANPELAKYLRPGVTTNWDSTMQQDLLAALKLDGIDPKVLDDKTLVQQVSRWLLSQSKSTNMFGTLFVAYPNGTPQVLPGLETAFAENKGDPRWSVQEQFEHELLGRSMFYHRSYGTCTSFAIYQVTVLRALGIPTRTVVCIPIVDANDPVQVEMVRKQIHHHGIRQTILHALRSTEGSFANHTFNEVYVGGKWVRLNYDRLGQSVVDRDFLGLMVHVNTFADLSDMPYAQTWGKRYATGEHDAVSSTPNPYQTLEISDRFGANSVIPNPPVAEEAETTTATIGRIYWPNALDSPALVKSNQGASEGRLFVHLEDTRFDQDWTILRDFLEKAPKDFILEAPGQKTVVAKVTAGSVTSPRDGVREAELVIAQEAYSTMAQGVEYTLKLPTDEKGFGWRAAHGLTIARR